MVFFCFLECTKCITSKAGRTCCAKGGSWYGKCGRSGDNKFEHTWGDGVKACAGNAAERKKAKIAQAASKEDEDPKPSLLTQQGAVSASAITDVTPTAMLMGFICYLMFELVYPAN